MDRLPAVVHVFVYVCVCIWVSCPLFWQAAYAFGGNNTYQRWADMLPDGANSTDVSLLFWPPL